MLLGKRIHAGAGGEVVGRLGTAVQHHDQRHWLAGAAGGDVELVVARSGRVGESRRFESGAFGQRLGNGAETGNAGEAAEPIAQSTAESADVETGRHVLGGEVTQGFGKAGPGLGVELAGEFARRLSGSGAQPGCGLRVGVIENDRFHVDDGGEPEPVCAGSGTSPPWSRRWMRAVAPIRSPAWVRRGASAIPRGRLLGMSMSFYAWKKAMRGHEEARVPSPVSGFRLCGLVGGFRPPGGVI